MFTKILSLLIIVELIAPPQVFAKRDVYDGEEVDIRACGSFTIKADLELNETPDACRLDDKSDGIKDDKGWKTPGANVALHVSKADLAKAKNPKQLIDIVLLNMIREKVKVLLKQFAWTEVMKVQKSDDPKTQQKIDEMNKKYAEFSSLMLPDEVKNPRLEVQKLLTFYPGIEAEILHDHPDFKPLICKYELHRHREKILETFATIVSVTAAIVTLVGAPVTAYFLIPALPKLLLVAGALNMAGGTAKLADGVMHWDDLHVAKAARALLRANEANEKLIKKLKKDVVKNKEVISYLQDNLLTQPEIENLKKLKKMRGAEARKFLSGFAHIGMGLMTWFGGLWADKTFQNFSSDAPANVTDPVTPPAPNEGG